jgi:hypothetical protein
MAELLDETGRVMPEYEKEKCLVRSVAGPVPLVWGTPPATYGVSRLAGRTLRLRIYLRDAKIYALTTA